VEEHDLLVVAPDGDEPAVGRNSGAVEGLLEDGDRAHLLARDLPGIELLVDARDDDLAAVSRPLEVGAPVRRAALLPALVERDAPFELARLRVEQTDLPVPAARRDRLPVRRVAATLDEVAMLCGEELDARRKVPDAELPVAVSSGDVLAVGRD